jgi:hypothetical protein
MPAPARKKTLAQTLLLLELGVSGKPTRELHIRPAASRAPLPKVDSDLRMFPTYGNLRSLVPPMNQVSFFSPSSSLDLL